MIEILVVLVIIGLLAGVALPRLLVISKSYEVAAQKENLLSEIDNLGYRAYSRGQPIDLFSKTSAVPVGFPVAVPPEWWLETPQPIHYSFNGICSGGKIILFGPNNFREELQLDPPLCKPVTGKGTL